MDSFDTNFRAVKHEVEEVYAAFLTERETGKSLCFEALVVTLSIVASLQRTHKEILVLHTSMQGTPSPRR